MMLLFRVRALDPVVPLPALCPVSGRLPVPSLARIVWAEALFVSMIFHANVASILMNTLASALLKFPGSCAGRLHLVALSVGLCCVGIDKVLPSQSQNSK